MLTSASENQVYPLSSDENIKKTHYSDAIKVTPTLIRHFSKENDKYMVTYYYSQALVALVINLSHLFFGPLILPFLRLIYSQNLLHSLVFSMSKEYFTGDFLHWFWCFYTILVSTLYPASNESLIIVYIATGSVIFLRQILVSIKYGYYTKKKWEKMKSTIVDTDFIYSNMILKSWVCVPQNIAKQEILSSLKRLKIRKKRLNLHFSKFSSDCLTEDYPEESDYLQTNNLYVEFVAAHLIKKVVAAQKFFELTLLKCFGVFYAFLMVFLMYYYFFDGVSEAMHPFIIVYVCFSTYKSWKSSTQFVSFIAAGLYDFNRKKLLMAQCSGLISINDQKYLLFVDRPQLDLNEPETVLSWYFLRRSFLEFGRRYTLRVFLYASLVFPVCIFIIITLILQLFGVIGVTANFYLIPSLLLGLAVFYVIIHMAIAALSLNKSYSVHRDLLLEKIVTLKNQENANQNALRNLEYVIQKLKHDAEVRPITIIGITIDDAFIVKIFVLAISGIFAAIQLAYKKG